MDQRQSKPDIELPGDLKCMRCGYSLRGLDTSGTCPECGLEVATTLAGPDLHNANPFWLHRLMYGITGVLGGIGIVGLTYVVRLLIQLTESSPRTYEFWLNHVTLMGWTVQWCSALFLLSPAEPETWSQYGSLWSLRRLLLYSAVILIGMHIVPMGLVAPTLVSLRFYDLAFVLLDHIGMMILLAYLFTLVRRTRDSFLNQHFPFALAAMAGTLIFSFVLWYVWKGFSGYTLTALFLTRAVASTYLAYLLYRFRGLLIALLPKS